MANGLEAPVCQACGSGPHPRRSGVCERGHFIKANTAAVTTGEHAQRLPPEREEEGAALRDRLLRERGIDPDRASALAWIAASNLANASVTVTRLAVSSATGPGARRNAIAISKLLDQVARATKLLDSVAIADTARGPAASLRGLSDEELAGQVRKMVERGQAWLASLERPAPAPAVAVVAEPSLPPSPPSPPAAPKPVAQEPEPEPEMFVGRHRITDADVRNTLRNEGDEALTDYVAGRTPKWDAYARTLARMRQQLEWR